MENIQKQKNLILSVITKKGGGETTDCCGGNLIKMNPGSSIFCLIYDFPFNFSNHSYILMLSQCWLMSNQLGNILARATMDRSEQHQNPHVSWLSNVQCITLTITVFEHLILYQKPVYALVVSQLRLRESPVLTKL